MTAAQAGRALAAERRPSGALGDRIFHGVTAVSALIVLALIGGIAISLLIGAWPALEKFGFAFLTSTQWNPVTDEYGALVAIFGTLVTSALAMLIAVPVSFGIALFVTELAPLWLRRPVSTAIELLAAIPSIIYGMWGLFVLAPVLAEYVQPWLLDTFGEVPLIGLIIAGPPIGIGVFTAGMILAIMVIPFITAVMRDTFEVVPPVLKESSYALGATTWEVVRSVVLPYTKTGVIGGIMLGLGRALGETMAVTFVIGNAHSIHAGLFYPGNSISAALANEFTEAAGGLYTSALIALGLVLFVITLVVLVLARLLLLRLSARQGQRP
ncbi:MAG TPA: phosphate ABC transporter permease subunit PstC [Salinisphaera sp.]|nr:phosphate ABC transporter permease subunit PstC [Salinisphaera sp.]HET7312855.1 phosphate ABC transporter permease subunit PstC [Salinisphaera sp.]